MADRAVVVKLKADIGDMRSKLREMERMVKKVGDETERESKRSASSFGKMLQAVGRNEQAINTLSSTATRAGLAMAAGAALAVKGFADFDQAMSAVAATGQDARDNIEGLREVAIRLGADTQYSAGEAAQGMEELLKAGVSAADVIGGGLAGALDLAAAGQISVAEASETAATAMVQFRLSGEDVPHIADLLAAAAGKAQGGVGDMAQALKQAGLVSAQFGLSVEETVGTLGAFASAGMLGSDAGTSMRTMLLRLANPAGKAADAMAELGIQAYDLSTGEFVGLPALAGQLQDALSDLTQAERDKALATIFGMDAIRGANVLYEQGEQGIRNWIAQVDDAGFAAEQAATKTDNLYGDLERLGGAFETVFVQGGSGANEALRGLVQGLEGVVETVGGLPPSVLNAGAAVTGFGGLALLAVGGVGKLAVGAADVHDAMRSLNKDMPKTAAGIRGIGRAAGAAGVALAAVMAAGLVQSAVAGDTFTVSVEDMTGALKEWAQTGSSIDLDSLFSVGVMGNTESQLTGLSDALETFATKNSSWWERFQTEFWGATPITTDVELIENRLKALDKAMAGLSADDAAEAFRKLSDAATDASWSADMLVKQFPELAGEARALAESVDYNIGSTDELVAIMRGEFPPAMKAAMAATEAGRKVLDATGQSAKGAALSIEELTEAAYKQHDAMLALSDAEIGYEQALDDATASVKENGRTLDINTQAGRDNQAALNRIAAEGKEVARQMAETGAGVEELGRRQQRTTEDFVRAAMQMGHNRQEAEGLAVDYGLVPTRVRTDISTTGVPTTKKELKQINDFLEDADRGARAVVLSTWRDRGAKAALRTIRDIRSKSVTVTTHFRSTGDPNLGSRVGNRTVYIRADGGPIQRLADGGFSSPGNSGLRTSGGRTMGASPHPRADNIPTLLTAGEFVHPVAATSYYGYGVMEALRSRAIPKSLFAAVGLADGGSPEGRRGTYQAPRLVDSFRRQVVQAGTTVSNENYFTQTDPGAAYIAFNQYMRGL